MSARIYKSTKKLDPEKSIDCIKQKLSEVSKKDYDFTKTIYVNRRTPITITYKKHGDFQKLYSQLVIGFGCNICDKHDCKINAKLSIEEYKIFASEIHNGRYDYSLMDKRNGVISIICKDHGVFTTRASAHIAPNQRYGCFRCSKNKNRGEHKIETFLDHHKIKFIDEWMIEGVVGSRNQPLRYDYYLPEMNLLID